MIPAKIYEFTLAGNASRRIQVAGRYFKILAADGELSVTAPFGTLSPLTSGQGLENTPFNELYVTDVSGVSNTIRIVVASEKFIDGSLGDVAVTSTKAPTLANVTSAAANVTNASGNLLAANATRQYLFVQNNDSTGIVYLNLAGAVATAANSIKLMPGESFEPPYAPVGVITAIGSIAANGNVIVVEGT